MKIPEVLIYNPRGTYLYKMFNTKDSKYLGKMVAYPNINKQLNISELIIFTQRRQGLGTKFLNLAKNLSKECGCEGRMILDASTTPYDPHNPPHIFYRKYGFTSDNKKFIKKIDKHIQKDKQLNYMSAQPLTMYYPDESPRKITIFRKIKNFLDKKFYDNL